MPKIYLPLFETAKVNTIKLPLKETAWVLMGFVIKENIIQWHEVNLTMIENVKSRILFDTELVDKNHIKIRWYGETVPKVQIYRRGDSEEYDETKPFVTLNYTPQEYVMLLDLNAYAIKMKGINKTGESDELVIGSNQNTEVDVELSLPINEKYHFIELEVKSEYRIEVNL